MCAFCKRLHRTRMLYGNEFVIFFFAKVIYFAFKLIVMVMVSNINESNYLLINSM